MSTTPTPTQRSWTIFGGPAGRVLTLLAAGYLLVQIGRTLVPLVLPSLISTVDITSGQAGLLLAVMRFAYSGSQYPSGRFSDRLTRATLVAAGLVLLIVGFGVFALVSTFGLLLVSVLPIGMGRAAFGISARALVGDRFRERRGLALGVFASASEAAGILASAIALVVLPMAPWQTPYIPITAGLCVLLALFHRWKREPYDVSFTSLDLRATVTRLGRSEGLHRVLPAYLLFQFTVRGVIDFLPVYLQTGRGFAPVVASGAFALLYATGIPSKLVGGSFGDRYSRPLVTAIGLVIGTCGLGGLLVAEQPVWVVVAVALFAVGYKPIFPLMDAFFIESSPDGKEGSDLGAYRAVGSFAGGFGPAFVGIVAGRSSYRVAFAGLLLTFAISGLLFGWLAIGEH